MTLISSGYRSLLSSIFPEKANTERPPMSIGTNANILGSGLSSGTNHLSQMQAMTSTSWLFAVIDRIASSTAAVPWGLFRMMPDGESRRVERHPLLDLWGFVNPFTTRHEFLETSIQHFELTGETWWLIVRNKSRRPVEIWNIRPDRIRPVPHPTDYISGYIYQIGTTQIPLEKSDVVFIKRPSPIDPYRGIGTVASMMMDLGSEQMSAQWTRNFFQNGAAPSGVIEFEESMNDQDWERLVQRWGEQHQGVANAHRVAILERGHWVDRKYSVRDMQMEQLRKLNRDIIFGAFGIPTAVMGVAEMVNRANAEAGDITFSRYLMKPRLERIKQALNERLVHAIDKTLFFDYEDPTPENRDLNSKIAQEGYKNGLLTRNEGRAMLGLGEADEGGEEFFSAPAPTPVALGADGIFQKAASDIRDDDINEEEDAMASNWTRRLAKERDEIIAYLEELE
jgi:HK97 family phage portal protein